jgi:hypothetical protein
MGLTDTQSVYLYGICFGAAYFQKQLVIHVFII